MTDDQASSWPDRLRLGEGARWVDGRVLLVDILLGRLLEATPGRTGPLRELARCDLPLGAVAPLARRAGLFLAAVGDGIALLEPPGRLTWLARPEAGRPGDMRMNDGVADPQGRFFAGSMDQDGAREAGRLYRVDPDGSVAVALDGLTIPNGPAFDPRAGVMYLADTAIGTIWRFRHDAGSGECSDREVFAVLDEGDGAPDGMTVDDEGRLWVALWGAGRVVCFDAGGRVARTVPVPACQPTSVCLSPAGTPGSLWITSAAVGLDPPGADDGALFRLPVDVTAPPASAVRLEGW